MISPVYSGLYARWYDALYAEKPYAKEARFVHRLIRRYGAGGDRVLELACGTGSHAIELNKLGYDVLATDNSPSMIRQAKAKANGNASGLGFKRHDMVDVGKVPGSFDAVVCLFDSLGFVVTDTNVRTVLKGVLRKLAPGGVFVFEFWNAHAMRASIKPLAVRRVRRGGEDLVRISRTDFDRASCTATIQYELIALSRDGTYRRHAEVQRNRGFEVATVRAWLNAAGFVPLRFFPGFKADGTVNRNDWHVVAVARTAARR